MKKLIATAAVCAALIFSETAALENQKVPEITTAVTNVKEDKSMKKVITYVSECDLTLEEIDEIAKVVIAEAEGESEKGQRYVIDVILNRVDSKWFPDTVHDVLYQKNQFCVSGKRAEAWKDVAQAEYNGICEMIEEEYDKEDRLNSDIVFFRTQRYSSYGVPAFKCGAHYFSTYDHREGQKL